MKINTGRFTKIINRTVSITFSIYFYTKMKNILRKTTKQQQNNNRMYVKYT